MTDKERVRSADVKSPANASGTYVQGDGRPKGKRLLRKVAKNSFSESAAKPVPAELLGCECSHCGTVIEFDVDRCAVCGPQLDEKDFGMVRLFEGMDFYLGSLAEADCPYCGEHLPTGSCRCPSCAKEMRAEDLSDPAKKVNPVVTSQNVVFLHLDVESGQLNYLQKSRKMGTKAATLHIEGADSEQCRDDLRGPSRAGGS